MEIKRKNVIRVLCNDETGTIMTKICHMTFIRFAYADIM